MRKLVLVAVFLTIGGTVADAKPPMRRAREVSSVSSRYTLQWVIKPTEEARGDQRVSNAPETDIRAVSAANDRRRLRIDISLHNPVNKRKQVFYAFKIRYKGGVEDWFAYIPHNDKFVLWTMKYGRMKNRRILQKRRYSNWVQISDTRIGRRRIRNNLISLFIDKDKHFSSKGRGRRKWVTAQFFSGYFTRRGGNVKVADQTPVIRLSYVR